MAQEKSEVLAKLLPSENTYQTANIDECLRKRIWNDEIDIQFDEQEYLCPELNELFDMKQKLRGHEDLLNQKEMKDVISTQIDIYALGVTLY
jgi:hypothetical protein